MFDFAGALLLLALILLFGFVTARIWRSKNALVRWGGLVVGGLLTLVPTVLLAAALRGFYLLNQRHNNPVTEVQVAGTAEQIARGERLAHLCASCHGSNGQLPLSGTDLVMHFGLPPIGTLYAPNLTPSGNIKDWTDGELIRAIREGVHKDGRSLLIMPAGDIFRNLSDADVQALVAFLRSQPAAGQPAPPNRLNLFGRFSEPVRFSHRAVARGQRDRTSARNAGVWPVHGGYYRVPVMSRRPATGQGGRWPARPAPRP